MFIAVSTLALGSTQSPVPRIMWVPALGIKVCGKGYKCMELYLTSSYIFIIWCLIKHRDTEQVCPEATL
jgi:hypothetical protein